MNEDISSLIKDIKTATSEILNKDISKAKGFSKRQLKAIAIQAAYIKEGVAAGEIKPDLYDFFQKSLKDMIENFINTLKGIAVVILEKIRDAIIGILWKAIGFIV